MGDCWVVASPQCECTAKNQMWSEKRQIEVGNNKWELWHSVLVTCIQEKGDQMVEDADNWWK